MLMTGYFGGYSTQESALAPLEVAAAQVLADVVAAQSKPVVVQTIFPDGPTARLLRGGRDPGAPRRRPRGRGARRVGGAPAAAPAISSCPPAAPPVTDTSYDAARGLFADAGVAFSAARTVRDRGRARGGAAADGMAFPLVLKAMGRLHKSEGGGVVLGLRDEDEARAAYADMVARARPARRLRRVDGRHLARVELIVGCVRDPRFGPVLMVGLGGVFAEVLADTALALAPVSESAARRLLLSLRGAPLLPAPAAAPRSTSTPWRRWSARVSHLAAAHPELVELELNPVFAGAAAPSPWTPGSSSTRRRLSRRGSVASTSRR